MTESPAMQAARRIFRPTNDQAVEQVAGLIEKLEWYADTFCELGKYNEGCGKFSDDICSGCKARSAILNVTKGD